MSKQCCVRVLVWCCADESEVQLSGRFLEEMMDINEQLACRDTLSETKLRKLQATNDDKVKLITQRISDAFDENDLQLAKQSLAELKFYMNVAEKIKHLS